VTDFRIKAKVSSVALVHERTAPTERPLLVGEVIDNFCIYFICFMRTVGHVECMEEIIFL
jgi:hypothetical protein